MNLLLPHHDIIEVTARISRYLDEQRTLLHHDLDFVEQRAPKLDHLVTFKVLLPVLNVGRLVSQTRELEQSHSQLSVLRLGLACQASFIHCDR